MASAVVATVTWLNESEWLRAYQPEARALTKTTADLELQPWQIRVVGAGGPMKRTLGAERLILEIFGPDEPSAIDFANKTVRQLAFHMRGVIGDSNITKVTVDQLPATTPYENPAVSQQVARLTVWLRSISD